MRIILVLLTLLTLGTVSPAPADQSPGSSGLSEAVNSPRHSKEAAIRSALAAAKRRKIDLSRYNVSASFEVTAKQATWVVYFEGRDRTMEDDCFWIFVDDRTGKVNPLFGACG